MYSYHLYSICMYMYICYRCINIIYVYVLSMYLCDQWRMIYVFYVIYVFHVTCVSVLSMVSDLFYPCYLHISVVSVDVWPLICLRVCLCMSLYVGKYVCVDACIYFVARGFQMYIKCLSMCVYIYIYLHRIDAPVSTVAGYCRSEGGGGR